MGDQTSKRERLMPLTSAPPRSSSAEISSPEIEIAVAKLKEALKKTPQVLRASFKTTCDTSESHPCNRVRAWILVDRYDDSTIDDIYEIQRDLLQRYGSLEFDLNVIASSPGALDMQLPGDDAYFRQ
jgi:hypothetical protein